MEQTRRYTAMNSPIAEMHSGLIPRPNEVRGELFHDDRTGDEDASLPQSAAYFKAALSELSTYLSPPWEGDGTDTGTETDADAPEGGMCDNSVDEIATYVSAVVDAYEAAAREWVSSSSATTAQSSSSGSDAFLRSMRSINASLFDMGNGGTVVAEHAQLNLTHCKKLLAWLRRERWPWLRDGMTRADLPLNLASEVKSFVSEYNDWASGPWRDVVLLEFIVFTVLPPVLRVYAEVSVATTGGGPQAPEKEGKTGAKGDVGGSTSPSTETEKEGAMSVSDEASDLLSVLSANGTRRKV